MARSAYPSAPINGNRSTDTGVRKTVHRDPYLCSLYFLERKKKGKRKSISIKISISRRLPLQGKRTSSSNVNQKPVSFPPKASTRRGCDQGTGQHSPPVERDTKQRHQFRYGRVRSGVTPADCTRKCYDSRPVDLQRIEGRLETVGNELKKGEGERALFSSKAKRLHRASNRLDEGGREDVRSELGTIGSL